MSEETHKITYRQEVTETYTRAQIEEIATGAGYFDDVAEACREWLANNPQGMTRDEFDSLPDGSVVALDGTTEYIKVGNRLGFTNHGDCVTWFLLDGQSLPDMTVVSTPAPPTLDDVDVVRDGKDGWIWRRRTSISGQLVDRWMTVAPDGAGELRSTQTLLTNRGPLTPLLPGPQIGGEA